MKCGKCGDDLQEVRRTVEQPKQPSATLVISGYSSKKTGKQSCKRGGPHSVQRMSSTEIWDAIDQQNGKSSGL